MPFVLTARCTRAKSRELVIWAPTVVMRLLQCNRPNQIFGCASLDAMSHIVTVVLAQEGAGTGREAPGRGGQGEKGEGSRGLWHVLSQPHAHLWPFVPPGCPSRMTKKLG